MPRSHARCLIPCDIFEQKNIALKINQVKNTGQTERPGLRYYLPHTA